MNSKDKEFIKIDFECSSCRKAQQQLSKIPIRVIISKLDECFATNNLQEAQRLLEYWQNEAVALKDLSGELSIVNEQLGLYRKTSSKDKGLLAVERALELINILGIESEVSAATVMLNAATTCKAFGSPERAVGLYEKTAVVYRKNLDDNDLKNAAFYNNYATTLVDLERYDDAEKLYEKALKITSSQEKALLDCAVTYVNMAHLYENREGPFCPLIEKCLQSAEEILESKAESHDGYYAFVCEKCAPSYDYFGYFVTAQKLKERAKRIYEGN